MAWVRAAVLAGSLAAVAALGAGTAIADDAVPGEPPHVSPPLLPAPPPPPDRARPHRVDAIPEVAPSRPGPAPMPHAQAPEPGPVPMPPIGPRADEVPLDDLLPDAQGPDSSSSGRPLLGR